VRSPRNAEASRRQAERRQREDQAPRLKDELPELVTLDLELSERKGEADPEMTHVKRVVIASAPAHFEIPCGDPSCDGGGHDITHTVMRALRGRLTKFDGEDVCHGSVRSSQCGRVLRYAAVATYRSNQD
jgi:hypothetical protein